MDHKKISLDELNRLTFENFKSSEKTDIKIVLDNLRSGNNIGSIFRSADAFRIKNIYITGLSATPPNKEILKTALGATESVDWEYHENGLELAKKLKSEGVKLYAIEQATNSILLQNFCPSKEPIALIFGNEVDGVNQEIIDICDAVIEIPQFGTKHSLNVAVSSGIVLWHLINQKLTTQN
ncbi:MAG: RNA methyltransferase [Bacteroidetes bacterium B1(2017)]|nr:MAG: RNA methyltransferase [Bacteroidetes bacterium B1(2017)]